MTIVYNMDMNTVTLPKKDLKTRRYSMDMNKDSNSGQKGLKDKTIQYGYE